jgi:AICAR transformylase/IMP cyclohydrolase PurH
MSYVFYQSCRFDNFATKNYEFAIAVQHVGIGGFTLARAVACYAKTVGAVVFAAPAGNSAVL